MENNNHSLPRVVVTGLGMVTPLGLDVLSTWQNLLNGVPGPGPLTRFDASGYAVRIASEVKNFNPEAYPDVMEKKESIGRNWSGQSGRFGTCSPTKSRRKGSWVTTGGPGPAGRGRPSAYDGATTVQLPRPRVTGVRRVTVILPPAGMHAPMPTPVWPARAWGW